VEIHTIYLNSSLADKKLKCVTLTWLAPRIKPTRPVKEEAKKSKKQEIIRKKKELRR